MYYLYKYLGANHLILGWLTLKKKPGISGTKNLRLRKPDLKLCLKKKKRKKFCSDTANRKISITDKITDSPAPNLRSLLVPLAKPLGSSLRTKNLIPFYQILLVLCRSLVLDKIAILQYNNYLFVPIIYYISLLVVGLT